MSSAVIGVDGFLVEVETDILNGLPSFSVVGLPDKAVEEARERVRSAIKNSGADFPVKRITVNLAPSDSPKEGSSFDMPIAVSMLLASEQIANDLDKSLFIGELSLNGKFRLTRGVLPAILLAKKLKFERVFVPIQNLYEASMVSGIDVYAVESLRDLILFLDGKKAIEKIKSVNFNKVQKESIYDYDLKDIKGQESVKRAIEVAVSGGHNILLKGPPGSGKTLIAKTIPSLLPPLTFEEALEVTKIYSISGLLNDESFIVNRPFRSPHHTTSYVGLIGGSANPKPGEISLAHRGVLFLDEFPEFSRSVLESLRQPLEDGVVSISRAKQRISFPADFMLVAASNPCPCGYQGDTTRECICTSQQILRYQKRLSGPLLDRIDIHVDVPAVKTEKLVDNIEAESSNDVRKRINKARSVQKKRFESEKILTNGQMGAKDIKKYLALNEEVKDLMKSASDKLSLSARSFHKVLKVARTIADLDNSDVIKREHVLEALQYRPRTFDTL